MSWSRIVNIYLDTEAYGTLNPLLESLTGSSPLQRIGFVAGDAFTLRIWPRVRSAQQGASTTTSQLQAGSVVVFSGKSKSALSAPVLLFGSIGFTEAQSGDDYYYQATVSLTDDSIQAALGSESSLLVRCDIEIESAANDERLTFQFDATIYQQVYTSGDPLPLPVDPVGFLTSRNVGSVEVPIGQNYVDVDLTDLDLEQAPLPMPMAVLKPTAEADNLIVVGTSGASLSGFRIHFASAPAVSGYQAPYIWK